MSIERIRKTLYLQNPQNQHPGIIQGGDIGDFQEFIGKHRGNGFLVCGCGSSLNTLENTGDNIVIGVNDVGRKLTPDYLVIVNNVPNFKWGRWEHVRNTRAKTIFTHIKNLPIENPERNVILNLGKFEGFDINNLGFIDYTTNSPYMAVIIAYQLGARKIGIIGVDFTPNHFFKESGTHIINRDIDNVIKQYKNLGEELIKNGVKIANLSQESMITSWPKMSLEEFETI